MRAKSGAYVGVGGSGLILKAQAFGGYIKTKSGRRLAYQLVVNNVPFTTTNPINDIIQVFQDEGTISAILWRDN